MCSARKLGRVKWGKPCGMPPNLLPMVSTGRWKMATAAVAEQQRDDGAGKAFGDARPEEDDGERGRGRRRTVCHRMVLAQRSSSLMRGRNSLGTGGVVRPRKSLICVEAMSSAMPLVNPMVTGRGMNLTAVPRPVKPMMRSRTPAMTADQGQAGDAELGDDAGDDDDEGAGRAADLGARSA